MSIRIVVKPTSGGQKLERETEPSQTVLEVKEALAEECGIPAADQRLIYKGQILKDERTLDSYGIGNDHVLHLVRASRPPGSAQSSSAAAATNASAATSTPPGAAGSPASAAMSMPGPLGGLMDSTAMQQMMQSPLMQQLLNNPDMLRSMLQMNPAVRELMDRDPQMAQLLNNPELLRESMNLMSNPNLMREYMRNNDRAISNIEALPGGFNALRQLYENVQGTAAGGAGGAGGIGGAQNPMPGFEGLMSSLGSGRGMDMSALLGGGPGNAQGMSDFVSHMMADPAMRETMINMISQPGILDMIASNNPQLQQMMNAMPGVRETMQNPEVLRMMLSPQMMRMATQMAQQGGMGGAAGGGDAAGGFPNSAMLASLLSGAAASGGAAGSGGGAAAGGASGAGGGNPAGPGLEGLMGMLSTMGMGMGGMGGLGGIGGAAGFGGLGGPAPVADPATTYATQIQQLQDMGFYDREAIVRALQATGGNVNAAVDRLLQGL
eukprot:gene4258-4509_t